MHGLSECDDRNTTANEALPEEGMSVASTGACASSIAAPPPVGLRKREWPMERTLWSTGEDLSHRERSLSAAGLPPQLRAMRSLLEAVAVPSCVAGPLALCYACSLPEVEQAGCTAIGLCGACCEHSKDEQDRCARERLQLRLDLYGVEERPIRGDGNCQFASASDQLYGTPRHHKAVRAAVVRRLKSDPDHYSPYVPRQSYEDYVEEISGTGSWGDHVTLQALADAFGVSVVVLTSFAQESVLEIRPWKGRPNTGRVLWLSFCAEVHYQSLYPRAKVAPEDELASDCCIF